MPNDPMIISMYIYRVSQKKATGIDVKWFLVVHRDDMSYADLKPNLMGNIEQASFIKQLKSFSNFRQIKR
uniref:Uncharacterized protein n=1 Tax=Romanomermis culicivorax TaxID=13658 RepID=A0A915ISJ7_ROMCU